MRIRQLCDLCRSYVERMFGSASSLCTICHCGLGLCVVLGLHRCVLVVGSRGLWRAGVLRYGLVVQQL